MPGLNCYSCPGALGSCPIGSLQAVLDSGKFRFSCYVLGFLVLFGAVLGRFVCGWLCPFGLVQDLLHKIPLFQKKKNLPGHRVLRWLKFVVLGLFVILLPMTVTGITGMGDRGSASTSARAARCSAASRCWRQTRRCARRRGCCLTGRCWCCWRWWSCQSSSTAPSARYLCPLGAIYGLFNPIALYRYRVQESACVTAAAAAGVRDGHPGLGKAEQHRVHPLRQVQGCLPTGAIHSTAEGLRVKPYAGMEQEKTEE